MNQAKAGVYSSIDDPKELAQKIVAVLDNPEKPEVLGQAGRTFFLEHFERKKLTTQWKCVLEKILILTTNTTNDLSLYDSNRRPVLRKETSHF